MAMSCWARRCTSSACLRYPAMPVVVKTPALPVVVSPPASGVAGQWQIETSTDGVDARFWATMALCWDSPWQARLQRTKLICRKACQRCWRELIF